MPFLATKLASLFIVKEAVSAGVVQQAQNNRLDRVMQTVGTGDQASGSRLLQRTMNQRENIAHMQEGGAPGIAGPRPGVAPNSVSGTRVTPPPEPTQPMAQPIAQASSNLHANPVAHAAPQVAIQPDAILPAGAPRPAAAPVQAPVAPAQSAMHAIQPDAIIPKGAPRPLSNTGHAPGAAPRLLSGPVAAAGAPAESAFRRFGRNAMETASAHAPALIGGTAAVAGAGLLAHHMLKKQPQQNQKAASADDATARNHAKYELAGLGALALPAAAGTVAHFGPKALRPAAEAVEKATGEGVGKHLTELGGIGLLAKPSVDDLRSKHADGAYISTTDRAVWRKRCEDARSCECSLASDANGVYVRTHRARSKSYPSVGAIPLADIRRIGSTG